ncbi:MAG TPA: heme exporter protein CcmB [Candidatus Limnocylindria bacterium]|jgi:heme exporter protein B|nr:heme exporter protein CcmB [Candidatus Limnocylindria bacterium]
MNGLRADAAVALAIARKDALSELRGRQIAGSTLFFATLVLLLFGFALGPDARRLAEAAPGLLWLAIVFGSLLIVARLHQQEAEDGALEVLARYPVERHAIYLGKLLAGIAAVGVLGAVLLPVVGILYGIDLAPAWPALVGTLLLGTIGLAAVGTFYAGVTVRMQAREVMLPLLMLPVVAPLLLASVKATAAAVSGNALGDLAAWMQLLAVFDVVMVVAGATTYGHLLEE